MSIYTSTFTLEERPFIDVATSGYGELVRITVGEESAALTTIEAEALAQALWEAVMRIAADRPASLIDPSVMERE